MVRNMTGENVNAISEWHLRTERNKQELGCFICRQQLVETAWEAVKGTPVSDLTCFFFISFAGFSQIPFQESNGIFHQVNSAKEPQCNLLNIHRFDLNITCFLNQCSRAYIYSALLKLFLQLMEIIQFLQVLCRYSYVWQFIEG